MAGWIKLHRQLMESDMWEEKPFSRGQAWVDLLLMVNFEEKKILFDGDMIPVNRGQKITSIRKLCERWGWSNSKVNKFLTVLKNEKMIDVKSDTKKTVVTVVNYDVYQQYDNEKTSQKHHRNDTETSQKHTNKNLKNLKNEKNVYVPPKKRKDMTIEKEKRYTEEELEAKLLNREG